MENLLSKAFNRGLPDSAYLNLGQSILTIRLSTTGGSDAR